MSEMQRTWKYHEIASRDARPRARLRVGHVTPAWLLIVYAAGVKKSDAGSPVVAVGAGWRRLPNAYIDCSL